MTFNVGDKVEWRHMVNGFTYKGNSYTWPVPSDGRWLPATVVRIDTERDDEGEYRWVIIELYNGLQRKLSHPEQKIYLRHAG